MTLRLRGYSGTNIFGRI